MYIITVHDVYVIMFCTITLFLQTTHPMLTMTHNSPVLAQTGVSVKMFCLHFIFSGVFLIYYTMQWILYLDDGPNVTHIIIA